MPDHLASVGHCSGHTGVCNSAAFEQAGISSSDPHSQWHTRGLRRPRERGGSVVTRGKGEKLLDTDVNTPVIPLKSRIAALPGVGTIAGCGSTLGCALILILAISLATGPASWMGYLPSALVGAFFGLSAAWLIVGATARSYLIHAQPPDLRRFPLLTTAQLDLFLRGP